ncbi:flagellar motor protein MotD [Dyella japonica]|uniref:Flagellar motor protein MotB n=1 Tax=Dyella japonica A8 TaxID=1217721 RepID=A0A075K6B0_9GAMM|nr:flagellar motor protein MotD [Dyella japonica]AIF49177.1 flagellar motor protein MotB [Dyella japonica A8]
MARKKKHHEDHVNHEAWAIPYADLMTLLLAFFVVMYAVSVVNEGKYRVMSNSIIEAFNGSSHVIAAMPQTRAQPHNVDPAIASPQSRPGAATTPVSVPIPARPQLVRVADSRSGSESQEKRNLESIRDQVQRALQPLIDKQMVIVRKTTSWLEIELRTDILFASGAARLSPEANDILDNMASILKPFPNAVRIEGYTDDRPINTALYPSNWELSAARAASVARLFSEQGVDPSRLGIMGWGEYRPSADNTTADGRNHNRRVLIVVLSEEDAPKRFLNDLQNGQLTADDRGAPAPSVSAAPAAPAAVVAVAPAAGKSAPIVEVVAPKPVEDAPVNKVILARPVRTAQQDGDARPDLAPQVSLPDVAAGAISVGGARVSSPEHGP